MHDFEMRIHGAFAFILAFHIEALNIGGHFGERKGKKWQKQK